MQVLLVESNSEIRKQLTKAVHQLAHGTLCADSGGQALEIISTTHIDMVIAKRIMADLNGIELCRAVRSLKLNHYVYLMLSFDMDTRLDLSQVLDCGADDYTPIPFEPEQLRIKLANANRIITMERELNQKFIIIKRNYYQMIDAFAQTIEAYNDSLAGHCRRVGALALRIAKRHPQMKQEDRPILEAAGILHDIGLIGLPEGIIYKKRTELNGDETVLFRSHSQRGEQILGQVDLLKPVARLVGMHHEQCNGKGFPNGITENQIPLAARIIGAASMYDDLTHRERIQYENIPELLQQYRGYQIEPSLVDILLKINLKRMQDHETQDDYYVYPEDLRAGMVLSRDVIMTTGAFVMSAGTCLDSIFIEKLKRYHESGNITDRLFIRKQ